MDAKTIDEAQKMYRQLRADGAVPHKEVQRVFNLSAEQEYAINIFGREWELSPEYLVGHIHKVQAGMSIGQVAVALGFRAEDSL